MMIAAGLQSSATLLVRYFEITPGTCCPPDEGLPAEVCLEQAFERIYRRLAPDLVVQVAFHLTRRRQRELGAPDNVLLQNPSLALRPQAMMQSGLIGAVLYARDLPRLAEFYSAVTGLQVRTMREGFAVLGQEPSQLVIVRIPRRIAESISIETPPVRT